MHQCDAPFGISSLGPVELYDTYKYCSATLKITPTVVRQIIKWKVLGLDVLADFSYNGLSSTPSDRLLGVSVILPLNFNSRPRSESLYGV